MRFVSLVLVLGTLSCADKTEDSGTEDGHDHSHHGDDELPDDFDPATTVTTDGGTYNVSYTTNPSPIPESEEFSVSFSTSGGTIISVDGTMPTHGHGMNVTPELTDNGDGTYSASPFVFYMPGYWVIHATVQGEDGSTEQANFDVDYCE